MARTVKDAAIILQAIAGRDPYNNYTSTIPFPDAHMPVYVSALNASALSGARIGVPWNALNTTSNPTEIAAFYAALDDMRAAGAEVVDATFTVPSPNTTTIVLGADFVSDLAVYLAELTYNPRDIHSLEDLRKFTHSFPQEQYPDRDTARWDAALALGYNNTDIRFWDEYQRNLHWGGEGGLLGAIERNGLDAVVMPTSQAAGRAAIQGAPILTVPMGFYPADWPVTTNARGLVQQGPNVPFGISFLGGMFEEARLLGLAYAFETKTVVRKKGPKSVVVLNLELGDFVRF